MPIEVKTLDELEAIGRGAIRAVLPEADVTPLSDYDVTVRMAAAVAMGQQAQAEFVARQIFPADADEDALEKHARRYGMARLAPATAVGIVAIAAEATGVSIPSGSTITHVDGTEFTTTSTVLTSSDSHTGKTVGADSTDRRLVVHPSTTGITEGSLVTVAGEVRAVRHVLASVSCIDLYDPLPAAPPPGTAIEAKEGAVVPIVAVEAGRVGNKVVGDTMTLASPPTDVSDIAHICELGGGGDRETVEELRARVVAWEATIPAAGNAEHIRQLARSTPSVRVEDAVVFPGFRGLGTVDVFPIGTAGARVLPSAALTAVAARLAAELPEALDVQVEALSYGPATTVDVTITPERGYEADAAAAEIAIAAGSSVSQVRLAATPSAYEDGDRVQLQQFVAGRWQLYERRVVGRHLIAPYWIDLDEPLPLVPATSDPPVLPGGPLVGPVVAAILATFDALGPSAHLDAAWLWERHPLPSEAWSDALTRAALIAAFKRIPGIANVPSLTSPSSDVYPTAQQIVSLDKVFIRFQVP